MCFDRMRFVLRPAAVVGAVAVLLAGTAAVAHATPLNLTSTHPGDVASFLTYVDYSLDVNPSTGTLTAFGDPEQFDVNNQHVTNGLFSLSLTVDRATGAVVSGTMSITGDTDGLPSFSGSLLEGSIAAFGFHDVPVSPPEGSIFEFMVNVTGGALAAPYYTSGLAGIIMNISNGSGTDPFTGVFTAPFNNDGFSGSSDTFPVNVPEPSSFVILGLGAILLGWRAARRSRRIVLS